MCVNSVISHIHLQFYIKVDDLKLLTCYHVDTLYAINFFHLVFVLFTILVIIVLRVYRDKNMERDGSDVQHSSPADIKPWTLQLCGMCLNYVSGLRKDY